MRSHSLARQLLGRIAVLGVIAVLTSLALLSWQFERSAMLVQDRGMQAVAEEIAASLEAGPNGTITSTLPEEYLAKFNDLYFATVTDVEGRALLSFPPGIEHAYHPFEHHIVDEPQYFEHRYLGENENYLGVTLPSRVGDDLYWVQFVEEVPEHENLIDYAIIVFLQGAGGVFLLFVLAILYIAYSAAQTAVKAVQDVSADAERITAQRSSGRLKTENLPTEVQPLATAANAAFDRLDGALEAQRRFSADTAHELLTPLSILKTRVDAMADEETARELRVDIDALIVTVRELLELAEMEAAPGPPQTIVDLREIAVDTIKLLAPVAISQGLDMELVDDGSPVVVRGSSMALGRALRNLIENAIHHASGATRIQVEIAPGASVAVSDDGAGVDPALAGSIFERFKTARDRQQSRTGLGLAIVRQIMESHGGRIDLEPSPFGKGARFVLRFPNASGDGIED